MENDRELQIMILFFMIVDNKIYYFKIVINIVRKKLVLES